MIVLPCVYQFFGPAQTASSQITGNVNPVSQWAFTGSMLTPNTKLFRFSQGMPQAASAFLRVSWIPNATSGNVAVQGVYFDPGPANIVGFGEMYGDGRTSPENIAVDVTATINALVTAKVDKDIGFQMWDDGAAPWTLGEVRLEIDWIISP